MADCAKHNNIKDQPNVGDVFDVAEAFERTPQNLNPMVEINNCSPGTIAVNVPDDAKKDFNYLMALLNKYWMCLWTIHMNVIIIYFFHPATGHIIRHLKSNRGRC